MKINQAEGATTSGRLHLGPRHEMAVNSYRVRVISLAALLVHLAIGASGVEACTGVFCDDFNDNQTDSTFWSPEVEGTGPSIAEANSRLELTLPATSWTSSEQFAARYATRCKLHGDFDVYVDYTLITWPYSNGARVTLNSSNSPQWGLQPGQVGVGRVSFSPSEFGSYPREVYLMGVWTNVTGITSTADTSGTIRLSRQDTAYVTYYRNGVNWVVVDAGTATSDDVHLFLNAHSDNSIFTDQNILVAFDNFVVESGRFVCDSEPTCGNGIIEVGEGCDDGNTEMGDGCDSTCQIEPLPTCDENLAQCNSDLSRATSDLGTCNDNLASSEADLGTCQSDLNACITDPPVLDEDEDGEPDVTDLCSATRAGADVDSDGCTLTEFCSALDATTKVGKKICVLSDWRNDEPFGALDCTVDTRGRGSSDDICVPTP